MDLLRKLWKPSYVSGAFLIFLVLFPLFGKSPYSYHIFIIAMFFAMLASSWNILNGFAGIKSLGHHALFGLGAYVSAILSMKANIDPWIAVFIGGLVATVVGTFLALPVLRLRAVAYIAILTLAFAEIMKLTANNLIDLTRGQLGLSGIPSMTAINLPWLEINFNLANRLNSYYLTLLLLVIVVWVTYRISKSSFGLGLKAMSQSQDAAESLGVNVVKYKLIVFAVTSFIAGVIGGFYAHYLRVLTPDSVMNIQVMIELLAITFIGGVGTILGPVLGAFVIILGLEYTRFFGEFRMMAYGLFLIIIIMWMPGGIIRRLFPSHKKL